METPFSHQIEKLKQDLTGGLAQLVARQEALLRERTTASDALASARQEIVLLKNQSASSREQIDILGRKLQDLEGQLRKSAEEVQQLKTALSQRDGALSQARQQQEEQQRRAEEMEKQLQRRAEEAEKAAAGFQQQLQAAQYEVGQLKHQAASAREQIDSLGHKLRETENHLKKSGDENAGLSRKLQESEGQLKKSGEEAAGLGRKLQETEDRLQKSIEGARQLRQQLEEQGREDAGLKEALAAARQAVEDAKTQVFDVTAEYSKRVKQAEQQTEKMRATLQEEFDAEHAMLLQKMAEQEKQVEAATAATQETDGLRQKVTAHRTEMAALKARLVRKEEALAMTEDRLAKAEEEIRTNREEFDFILGRLSQLNKAAEAEAPAALPAAEKSGVRATAGTPSVTEEPVRQMSLAEFECACLNPDWRLKFINGEKSAPAAAAVPAGLPDYAPLFEQVAAQFVRWLRDPNGGAATAAGWSEKELWAKVQSDFAAKLLQDLVASGKFETTNGLSRRLRAYCKQLTELRARAAEFKNWTDVFPMAWSESRDLALKVGRRRIVVTGALSAVRTHPDFAWEIVALKAGPWTPARPDYVALALQALLFSRNNPGEHFRAAFEVYSPDVSPVEVSYEKAAECLGGDVLTALYELASEPMPAMEDARQTVTFSELGEAAA